MTPYPPPPAGVADFRVARAARVVRRLKEWMDNAQLDAEGQVALEPSCPVCTQGTVPDLLNRGLCAYHDAEDFLRKEGLL